MLGADANTPEHDMPGFRLSRTHWHTGMRKLGGEPGDDVLFGPDNEHRLTDASEPGSSGILMSSSTYAL